MSKLQTLKASLARSAVNLHVMVYRRTAGRLGGKFGGLPLLLLTTRGRKSGLSRTNPVGYGMDNGRFVVIASNNGADVHPSWFLNLRANRAATVHVGADMMNITATESTDGDYARLWKLMADQYPAYIKYAEKTRRHLPIIILTPVSH